MLKVAHYSVLAAAVAFAAVIVWWMASAMHGCNAKGGVMVQGWTGPVCIRGNAVVR